MKLRISTGEFTPNITNSWSGSKSIIEMDNKIFKYRSSWEAFFHLCNQGLEYEKIRIPYIFNEENHNYIVDFVDLKNNKLYEIKPNACLEIDIVKSKMEYAREWCLENNFTIEYIGDSWFKSNFNKNKYLLDTQKHGNDILKKLKQFDEN